MRNWIAGAMTVLGTLLVISGAAIIVMRNWIKPAPAPESQPTTPTFSAATVATKARSFMRMEGPDRLIAWGIVLLVLAAVAAGAIGFDLGANTQTR
jgi:hypothetical protein